MPASRPTPTLVSGSGTLRARWGAPPTPLAHDPQRGSTQRVISRRGRHGKTSACMYPYVDSCCVGAPGSRAEVGGLVLEVKATSAGSASDRTRRESGDGLPGDGLDTGSATTPAHDLDRRGRVCHWQFAEQLIANPKSRSGAATDLLKLSLVATDYRRGYDLAEVFGNHRRRKSGKHSIPESAVHNPPDVLAIAAKSTMQMRQAPWTLWVPLCNEVDSV